MWAYGNKGGLKSTIYFHILHASSTQTLKVFTPMSNGDRLLRKAALAVFFLFIKLKGSLVQKSL
jgi:hypothetical protein